MPVTDRDLPRADLPPVSRRGNPLQKLRIPPVDADWETAMTTAQKQTPARSPLLRRNLVLVVSYLAVMLIIAGAYAG